MGLVFLVLIVLKGIIKTAKMKKELAGVIFQVTERGRLPYRGSLLGENCALTDDSKFSGRPQKEFVVWTSPAAVS